MNLIGEFFSLKRASIFKGMFSPKEDKTDLNLLLRQLLNERTIEQSLKLKEELDARYREIMEDELNQKSSESKLISDYLSK